MKKAACFDAVVWIVAFLMAVAMRSGFIGSPDGSPQNGWFTGDNIIGAVLCGLVWVLLRAAGRAYLPSKTPVAVRVILNLFAVGVSLVGVSFIHIMASRVVLLITCALAGVVWGTITEIRFVQQTHAEATSEPAPDAASAAQQR